MKNKDENKELQEAFDKFVEHGKEFSEFMLKTDNGSSMLNIISLAHGEGNITLKGSVVGDPSVLAEMLSHAMNKDKQLAVIIMEASNRFVRPKIEQMVNSDMIPQMLESLLDRATSEECNCPKCRERRSKYN